MLISKEWKLLLALYQVMNLMYYSFRELTSRPLSVLMTLDSSRSHLFPTVIFITSSDAFYGISFTCEQTEKAAVERE